MRPKVLLVDDDTANLKLLRELLRGYYELTFAKNGADALILAAQIPDLILLDIMMPHMDGYEVCRRLKTDPNTCDIPVIFITAKTKEEDEIAGFELGAVDYITKPVSGPIVRARVKTHLHLKRIRKELESQNNTLKEAAQLRDDVEHIMRHDLKGPLNIVIGVPTILKTELTLNPQQEQLLALVEDCGYQLLAMVNNSLNIYKMERGVYDFEPIAVDLMLILDRVWHEVRDILRVKNLTLTTLIEQQPRKPGDTFIVSGEKLPLHTMMSNLVRNAVEASPRGETVTITCHHRAQAVMNIHNKGVVPQAVRYRFFDKFVTDGKKQGTGLGTYSARLIIETHGGTIELDTSEPGTTGVIVRLPLTL